MKFVSQRYTLYFIIPEFIDYNKTYFNEQNQIKQVLGIILILQFHHLCVNLTVYSYEGKVKSTWNLNILFFVICPDLWNLVVIWMGVKYSQYSPLTKERFSFGNDHWSAFLFIYFLFLYSNSINTRLLKIAGYF